MGMYSETAFAMAVLGRLWFLCEIQPVMMLKTWRPVLWVEAMSDRWFSLQRSISVHYYMIKAVYAVVPVKEYTTLELYSFVMKLNTYKYSEGGG